MIRSVSHLLGFALPFFVGLALTACQPAPKADSGTAATETSECVDDGERLPGTGLCTGRAVSYLNQVEMPPIDLPEGCNWVVNETEMPGGEFLLYRAAHCQGVTATLEYAGGAHSAELRLIKSGLNGRPLSEGPVLVRIFSAEGQPEAAVLSHVRGALDNAAEAKACAIRKADIMVWPFDALVADDLTPVQAKAFSDGPRRACGPLGLDEDAASYWRVFQGFAWFYDLGQDIPEIDPGSLTLVVRDAKGHWQAI